MTETRELYLTHDPQLSLYLGRIGERLDRVEALRPNLGEGIMKMDDSHVLYTDTISLSEEVTGNLDDIENGDMYSRVLTTDISAGHILLSEATGTLDNITDGDDYERVLATDITAGHILLSEATGNLDNITDGSEYGRVKATDISAGQIVVVGNTASININDTVFGNDGIQLQYNSGSPRVYVGNGASQYMRFESGIMSIGGVLTIDSHARFPSDEDLLGYWSFDEGSGYTLIDNSGNGYDGELDSTMTSGDWITGPAGYALDFDGSNDTVDIGNNPSTFGNGSCWVSFWMKSGASINSYGRLIAKWQDAVNLIYLSSNGTTDQLYMNIVKGSGNVDSGAFDSAFQPFDEEWHHIAWVLNRTTNTAYIYMDGVKGTTTVALDDTASDSSNTGDLIFAALTAAGSGAYLGALSEIRIYSGVPSDIEVQSLYLYPSGNKSTAIGTQALTITEGGDLTLIGGDSDPSVIKFDTTSCDLNIFCSTTGSYCRWTLGADDEMDLTIGGTNASGGGNHFKSIHMYGNNSIALSCNWYNNNSSQLLLSTNDSVSSAVTLSLDRGGTERKLYYTWASGGTPTLRPSVDSVLYFGSASYYWARAYVDTYYSGGSAGVTGSFEDRTGNTVTVKGGIITDFGV